MITERLPFGGVGAGIGGDLGGGGLGRTWRWSWW
jgi:hypothetical protein